MGTHILTLFGEEIVPEEIKAVGRKKSVATKKKEKQETTEEEIGEGTEETVGVPSATTDMLADWEGSKQYYTIGEVAKLFHVRTSNIRYWTKEFNLKVRTTRKGDRLYTPDQVKEIRTIYHLVKDRRFTISGAKAKLKQSKKVSVESVDLKYSLLQLRNKLVQLRNSLK